MILISSTAGLKGQPFLTPYVASKHGMVGIMRSLANELASQAHPGQLPPPHRGRHAHAERHGRADRADRGQPRRRFALPQLAAGRPGAAPRTSPTPSLFLASDEARYVTGLDHDRRRRGVGPVSAVSAGPATATCSPRCASGPVTVANRIVFSAHLTNYATDGLPTEQHAAYYAARAAGGAGLIITEEHSTHPTDWPYEKLIHGFHPG